MNKYILEYIWLGGNSELRSKNQSSLFQRFSLFKEY